MSELIPAASLVSAATPFIQATLSVIGLLDLGILPSTLESTPSAAVRDGDEFDFVIVGGGTAGCILANRLTEIEEYKVLLIEAGDDPPIQSVVRDFGGYSKEDLALPGVFPLLAKSQYDWDFQSTNDKYTGQHLQNNVIALTAGKMLGGSSSLDHQFYVKTHPDDYEPWVRATGDQSWSFDALQTYFKKSERMRDPEILSSRYRDEYGRAGYLNILKKPGNDAVNPYLRSFQELGYETVIDTSGDHMLGYTKALFTNYNNRRQSNSFAYLTPVKDRTNLSVLKNALATKIIIQNNVATGVQVRLQTGISINVRASKEVVVTAGTFNTAKILMLSGIGPRDHLESLNINVVSDLPVGYNYQDHVLVMLAHRMERSILPALPLDPFHFPVPAFAGYVTLNESKTQPDYQTLNAIFFHDTAVIVLLCSQSFSYEDRICQQLFEDNTGYNVYLTVLDALHPKSRGRVYLNSTNPDDYPIIDVGYLSVESDLENQAKYVQDFSRVINTTYFRSVGAEFVKFDLPECEGLIVGSLDYWRCYVVAMSSTTYHPSSTCSMGSVVDGQLRVFGVRNLRVGDASVIPETISANIKSAVNAIAEKLSDMIKFTYGTTERVTETLNDSQNPITFIQNACYILSSISTYLLQIISG